MGLSVGSVVVAFSYGGFWTLLPSLIGQLFGMQYFATLYNIYSIAVSSSSLCFSTVLAAKIYDHEASLHPGASGSGCEGPSCYRLTALVMASCAGVGIVAAIVLCINTRKRISPGQEGEVALSAER